MLYFCVKVYKDLYLINADLVDTLAEVKGLSKVLSSANSTSANDLEFKVKDLEFSCYTPMLKLVKICILALKKGLEAKYLSFA